MAQEIPEIEEFIDVVEEYLGLITEEWNKFVYCAIEETIDKGTSIRPKGN